MLFLLLTLLSSVKQSDIGKLIAVPYLDAYQILQVHAKTNANALFIILCVKQIVIALSFRKPILLDIWSRRIMLSRTVMEG